MAFDGVQWAWINGRMVPWNESKIHLASHGLHYGTGVFEGIRSYSTSQGPAIFRLDAHLDRFDRSAEVYGLKPGFSRQEIVAAVCEVVRKNNFQECYIRPIAYFGSETLGLRGQNPTEVAVLAWSGIKHVSGATLTKGARLTVSPYVKFNSRMMPTTAKATGQYLNSFLATREAMARGFDEALLLNTEGTVAEAAVANVFIVNGRTIRTNDEKSSILLGITRDSAIQLAQAFGYDVQIGAIQLDELRSADEVFVTGTAAEIVPVGELDGVAIGSGRPGPVVEKLRKAFDLAKTGQDSAWEKWLHRVPETVHA